MRPIPNDRVVGVDCLDDGAEDLFEEGLTPQYFECVEYGEPDRPLYFVMFVRGGSVVYCEEVLLILQP